MLLKWQESLPDSIDRRGETRGAPHGRSTLIDGRREGSCGVKHMWHMCEATDGKSFTAIAVDPAECTARDPCGRAQDLRQLMMHWSKNE